MCLVAVVALTVATLVVRGTGGGSNLMAIVGWQMAVGAVALALPSLLLEWGEPVRWTPRLVGALAVSIFIPGILATFIWFRLVTRIGAVRAAAFHFLSPPFGYALFYLRGVAPPEIPMSDIFKSALPFLFLQVVGLAACMLFPQIITGVIG